MSPRVVTLHHGGLRAEVLTHGAHLVGLWAPDRSGRVDNVVVSLRHPDGSVDVDAYRDPVRNPHLGGMAGRYANRIAGAAFELDGVVHLLVANEGPNQLHGGPEGFDRLDWSASLRDDGAAVTLRLTSPDGDQGFPGRVDIAVTYQLCDDATLRIDVEGTTDAPTVLNVTNHSYWNLAGTSDLAAAQHATIRDHVLSVAADRVVPVDDSLVPTGALEPVGGTPFDLRAPTRLGQIIDSPELVAVGGLDHCWVLDASLPSAELTDPGTGRRLRIETDQPGLQVYTANHGAGPLPRHGAICLESQHLPDSPNRREFPSPVLRPGETYHHRHVVRLDVID